MGESGGGVVFGCLGERVPATPGQIVVQFYSSYADGYTGVDEAEWRILPGGAGGVGLISCEEVKQRLRDGGRIR